MGELDRRWRNHLDSWSGLNEVERAALVGLLEARVRRVLPLSPRLPASCSSCSRQIQISRCKLSFLYFEAKRPGFSRGIHTFIARGSTTSS